MTPRELYAAQQRERGARQFTADRLAAELGCDVSPHPLTEAYEARNPAPGVWLISGTPEAIRAEVRKIRAETRERDMRLWLGCLGSLSGPK